MIDDLLDFTGTSETLGKPGLQDMALGLSTAPVLFAADEQPDLKDLIERKFSAEGDVQEACRLPGEDTPSLQRVCARATARRLDKAQQCSDWARRPLDAEQLRYAALDAHVLLEVHEVVRRGKGGAAALCLSASLASECEPEVE